MSEEKYGFVYIWYDSYKKMFYIGSHWGTEEDGYICSSRWMRDAYKKRPWCFKRRILMRVYSSKENLLAEEQYWLNMIKPEELASIRKNRYDKVKVRYYNLKLEANGGNGTPEGIGKAISVAKKGKPLTEKHKIALRKPKNCVYSKERKTEIGQKSHEYWDSEEGKLEKEKRSLQRKGQPREDISKIHKQNNYKPSKETIEASVKKCSKTYKVVSPNNEEMIVTNLKAFCRERGLTDINMVRKYGSKGWHAQLITA